MKKFIWVDLGPTATKLLVSDSDFKRMVTYVTNLPVLVNQDDVNRHKHLFAKHFVWLVHALDKRYKDGSLDKKEIVVICIKDHYINLSSTSISKVVKELTKEMLGLCFANYLSSIVKGRVWTPKGASSIITHFGTIVVK